MVFIQDGRGRGVNAAVSTKGNRLDVSSRSNNRIFYASRDDGQAYVWSSRYLVDAGSSILYLQNTSPTRNLIIDEIDVGATSGATWELWTCTTDGAGTVVSGANHNLTSSNSPEARAFGDANITANSSGVLVGYAKHGNFGEEGFHTKDTLILGQNDAIIIKRDPGEISTVSGTCTVIGYFE